MPRNYYLLTVIGAFAFAALGVSSPLMTLYLESLGASYAKIALILTSFVLTMLFGSYVWGRLSDLSGRRKPILIIGLTLTASAYAVLSAVPTADAAWFTRVFEAAGLAGYTSVSLALMGDLLQASSSARTSRGLPERRGRQMGVYRGAGSLAFALGAATGGWIADSQGLSVAFLVCGTLYLIAAVLSSGLREDRAMKVVRGQTHRFPNWSIQSLYKGDLPLPFLLGVICWMGAHAASSSMWPNFMASNGYAKSHIGALWAIAAAVEMPAMYGTGFLSDFVGRAVPLVAGGAAIALVNAGYVAFVTVLPALVFVQVLRGFGFGSYTTSAMTFTTERGPATDRGANSGTFYAVGAAGQLLGMLLGGTIVQVWGFTTMFVVCAVMAASSAVAFLFLRFYGSQTPTVEANAG